MQERHLFSLTQDHPRIRGTNGRNSRKSISGAGSSPHTRDKFSFTSLCQSWRRITPAYAGQMKYLITPIYESWDHPRIRGTNFFLLSSIFALQGSSLHTRDKYGRARGDDNHPGIIPAYAGQIKALSIGRCFL